MSREIQSCCDFGELLDFTKAELPKIVREMIYFDDTNFWLGAFMMLFNPFFWNVGARLEYNTKLISKLCGSAKAGCILLGATIIFFTFIRSRRYHIVLESQPYLSDCYFFMGWPVLTWIGLALIGWGLVLGVSSLYVLGFYGTYLGDYFGILMDAKVTSFPFSVTLHPMYYGSWMQYLGIALWYRSPAGLLLCCLLLIAYRTAISFEGPFTEKIYRQRDIKVSGKKQK
ncbi:Phosphatidyl-N-methylethanolamine N-methyltransferase [Holothuria leucospilota]|uniref:Phosphatidylethanolamine N-methyltransferase n=1 Tax=Holothuria leucospilota TaxID=206669 RepID=A0A9Q1C233_HOLLE|nr:Phosphatidyl-N-methylethanolamine N-methyltransferase [Holothuria leucospilota]